MSHIFDAMQRSERESSDGHSTPPAEAKELLLRAERRATENWGAAADGEGLGPADRGGFSAAAAPAEMPTAGGLQEGAIEDGASPGSAEADVFRQFQSVRASVPVEKRLVCLTNDDSPAAEAFRSLRVRLREIRSKRPLRSVLITSMSPGEGKTMSAANLGCILALRSSQKVLLLDGDLRKPDLSHTFGLENAPGLTEWMRGEGNLAASIYHLEGAGLWVLPGGGAVRNPLELLQSGRLASLMHRLGAWFDWLIVDSPPVLPLADAIVWAHVIDGTLLVTRQGVTEKRQLTKGIELLKSSKLIGGLVNCSTSLSRGYYHYYHRYHRQMAASEKDGTAA